MKTGLIIQAKPHDCPEDAECPLLTEDPRDVQYGAHYVCRSASVYISVRLYGRRTWVRTVGPHGTLDPDLWYNLVERLTEIKPPGIRARYRRNKALRVSATSRAGGAQ